jgi:hypothetical protein
VPVLSVCGQNAVTPLVSAIVGLSEHAGSLMEHKILDEKMISKFSVWIESHASLMRRFSLIHNSTVG